MNPFVLILKALNKAHIKYLIVGGVAVNLYGYPRFTGDLDLLALLNAQNLKKLDAVMRKLRYSERLPVSILDLQNMATVRNWLKTKNMKAYTLNPPPGCLLQVDIIIEESLSFEKFYKNKTHKSFAGISVPIIAVNDLISMKKRAKRTKDMLDLEVLKYLSKQ